MLVSKGSCVFLPCGFAALCFAADGYATLAIHALHWLFLPCGFAVACLAAFATAFLAPPSPCYCLLAPTAFLCTGLPLA